MDSIDKRTILVVNDVEETLGGIEDLLGRDGYRIKAAQNKHEAVRKVDGERTDLMLITLGGEISRIITAAQQIRYDARLSEKLPVIIFCAEGFEKPGETDLGTNIYHCCPDNFDQLREFIKRFLV